MKGEITLELGILNLEFGIYLEDIINCLLENYILFRRK